MTDSRSAYDAAGSGGGVTPTLLPKPLAGTVAAGAAYACQYVQADRLQGELNAEGWQRRKKDCLMARTLCTGCLCLRQTVCALCGHDRCCLCCQCHSLLRCWLPLPLPGLNILQSSQLANLRLRNPLFGGPEAKCSTPSGERNNRYTTCKDQLCHLHAYVRA